MRWGLPLLLLLLTLLGWNGHAQAATTCSVSGTPTLAFGPLGTGALTTTTNVTVSCTTTGLQVISTVRVAVCLGLGTGTGGSLTGWRRLANTTGEGLNYQIYSNAGRTAVFGTTSTTSPAWQLIVFEYPSLLGSASGSTSFTLYGSYPAGQPLAFGNFTSRLPIALQAAVSEPTLLGIGPVVSSCTTPTGGGIANSGLNATAGELTVTGNVAASCNASTYVTNMLDFGTNVGRIASSIDRQTTLSLTCVNRTPWQVGLNNGLNADSNGNRRMSRTIGSTTYYIPYELYRDAARSTRWGNTLSSTTLPGTGTGAAQTLTIYGRAPPTSATGTAPGTYSDTITVTITY